MPLSPSSLGLSHHTFRRSWSRVLIQNAEDLGPQPSMHVQYVQYMNQLIYQLLWNHFLHKQDHIGGENAMAMVFLVGPCCLGTGQTLIIGRNKVCRPVCESEKSFSAEIKKGMMTHLRICSRGMSSRHPSIFLFISSRVLTWPAMWNRSFAVPQYCSMKFNSQ